MGPYCRIHTTYPVPFTLVFCVGIQGSLTPQVLTWMGIIGNRYLYVEDLLLLDSYRPPPRPCQFSRGPSPINLHLLYTYFRCHPDQVFAAYIFRGLRDGFRIGFAHSAHTLVPTTTNHPSSRERPQVVTDHLQEEL